MEDRGAIDDDVLGRLEVGVSGTLRSVREEVLVTTRRSDVGSSVGACADGEAGQGSRAAGRRAAGAPVRGRGSACSGWRVVDQGARGGDRNVAGTSAPGVSLMIEVGPVTSDDHLQDGAVVRYVKAGVDQRFVMRGGVVAREVGEAGDLVVQPHHKTVDRSDRAASDVVWAVIRLLAEKDEELDLLVVEDALSEVESYLVDKLVRYGYGEVHRVASE